MLSFITKTNVFVNMVCKANKSTETSMSSNINIFSFYLLFITITAMMNNSIFDNSIVRLIIYITEVIFIVYIYNKSKAARKYSQSFVCFSIFMIISFIISYKTANYVNLLKYAGYSLVFYYGKKCCSYNRLSVNKYILFLLITVPLLLVFFFDHTPKRTLFFPNSNNFTYWGICIALFYYITGNGGKNRFNYSLIILFMYLAVGTSLGILVAFICSILIINRNNIRLILAAMIFLGMGILLTFYTDIPLFLRLQNQITVLSSLSLYDWMHLGDLSMYEVQQNLSLNELSRDDNTSALWRFQHWAFILTEFFRHWYYSFIVGLGDGYFKTLSGPPHNDYLRVLAEYGFIVFLIILKWIKKLFKYISSNKSFYFVLTILIYHFTENLVETFPASCLFYFSLGYIYYHNKYNTLENK